MANKSVKKSRICALDLGFDSLKVAYEDSEGIMQVDKFPSAISKMPNTAEIDDENNGDVFFCGPDCYAVCETALKTPKSFLMPLENFDDMMEIYVPMCSYVVNKYGKGFDDFDHVIIGVSLAFSSKVDTLLEKLYSTLNLDKENYFICLPQASSSRYCYFKYGLRPDDVSQKNKVRMQNFLICDIGGLTIDLALILQGSSSTGIKLGLDKVGCNVISYGLCDYMFKNYGIQLSLKTAQSIVSGEHIFVSRGRELDLTEIVSNLKKKYIIDVLNLLEEKAGETLDTISGILLCGGGAMVFKEFMNDPDIEKEITKHFSKNFLKIPELPEYFNVISYYEIAKKLIDEGKI